jgi:L-alanine-DL-glutamate epimerase-like enolase superfamily enzyme
MKVEILEAEVAFRHRPFSKPLQLSSGSIAEITEAEATVRIRAGDGEAVGRGAIYLSDLWGWPDPSRPHDVRDAAMRHLCERIAVDIDELCGGEAAHPVELGLRLQQSAYGLPLITDPPALARAICLSPFDAAIHDAAGIALGCSAFHLYEEPGPLETADRYFGAGGAIEAIRRTLEPTSEALAAWLIVGASDSIEKDVAPWVMDRRYFALKLKLLGKDPEADAKRTSEVFKAVREMRGAPPRVAVDPNCACASADAVLTYLELLRSLDPAAFEALEYLEQPTGRDIRDHPFDWRAVTALKPVVLDEGLTRMEDLLAAKEQGWDGIAVKVCRGHSFSLVSAAWAQEHGMRLMMQDLTNSGIAAIHSALTAAHLPVENGLELNSPQFTPAANEDWLPRLAGLLDPYDGLHHIPMPVPPGLGSML